MLSVGLGIAALGVLTVAGCARVRETKAEAAHPAVGQFVTVDGLRVHYATKGAGPDLILLHGASGNLRDWTFGLMDRLASDFRVTAF
ncbi:MAG: alpha/beta fold hydrolase, partial [Paracoccaceae bacterium]